MNAEIVNRSDARVLGIAARINPSEADYDDLWHRRFDPREPEVNPLAIDPGYVGVYYYGTGEPGMMDFVAGMIVGDVAEVPEGLVLRALPGGTYAAFSCTLRTLSETWRAIYAEWLPASGYAEDESRPGIEYFPPGTAGSDEPATIYVPIVAR
jgi:predicted transcriptional regulator YdeE